MTALDTEAPTVIHASRTLEGPHGTPTLDLSEIVQRLTRHVLYTVADVDHVDITITQAPSFTTSATIAKADLVSGHATYTFTNLPSGAITANQTANYAPAILLLPSSSAATPPAGGGSNPTPPPTNLAINLTLVDGGTAADASPLASVPIVGTRVAIDPSGNVWLEGHDAADATEATKLYKVSSAGAITGSTAVSATPYGPDFPGTIRFDNAGNVLISHGDLWRQFSNAPAFVFPEPYDGIDLVVEPTDDVWYLTNNGYIGHSGPHVPMMTVNSFPVPAGPGQPHRLLKNADGNLVMFRQAGDMPGTGGLWRFDIISPTGTVLSSYNRPETDVSHKYYGADVDPQGNFWVLSAAEDRLVKLSPTLSVLTSVPTYVNAQAMDVDAAGKVWVLTELPTPMLTRYANDGHIEAIAKLTSYGAAANEFSIAADGQGNVWVPGLTGLKNYSF